VLIQHKTSLVFAFISFSTLANSALSQQIAFTFDDAPRHDEHVFSGINRTKTLITQLKKSGVHQAAFFCNTRKMDTTGRMRLQLYSDAGHVIANHTHSHADLEQTELSVYLAEIEKAHGYLQGFSTFRRWFRFPFLREGNTVEKRDGVRRKLASMEYTNGYVTIDNFDWYMNKLLQKALESGRKVHYDRLAKVYIRVLIEGAEFYDAIAKRVLHRSPKHVLLLHENDLAALFIYDLVEEFKARNWSIVSSDEAYSDPIARMDPDTFFLNQGRVAALASDKGDAGPFWKWEEEEELESLFKTEKVFE
jgi:peptidoglycan/xylan/chitin deacetylase (PgdA/CDA1 family)